MTCLHDISPPLLLTVVQRNENGHLYFILSVMCNLYCLREKMLKNVGTMYADGGIGIVYGLWLQKQHTKWPFCKV